MNVTQLIIEYAVYAGIIVLGLLILALLKRKNKLPNHSELKEALSDFAEQLKTLLDAEKAQPMSGYEFFKKITKILYGLDKLILKVSLLAEKERDMQIANIQSVLEGVREKISFYKFGGKEELSELEASLADMDNALALADKILERDKDLKNLKKHKGK